MRPLRYLVTGASGFIGRHLVALLRREQRDVVTWVRSGGEPWSGKVRVANIDIKSPAEVQEGLAAADPDVVFHLAAQSLPMRSWSDPIETLRVNVEGTLNLLEAVRKVDGKPRRVLLAGSSGEYAASPDGSPLSEDSPNGPANPYAASKLSASYFAELYVKGFDLDIVRFRPFALIGTHKQGDIASDLARRVVAIERGAPAELAVGRTDVVRDMIDVRDGVEALLLLSERGEKGAVYNVCSGTGTSVAELVEEFRRQATVPFRVALNPDLVRKIDETVKVGNPDRIFAMGWRPHYTLTQSVATILDYWRNCPDLPGQLHRTSIHRTHS
jgi:GDP-4-dehydro-6-deoxy-D-mannose reductase